jgi:hypothetical protein
MTGVTATRTRTTAPRSRLPNGPGARTEGKPTPTAGAQRGGAEAARQQPLAIRRGTALDALVGGAIVTIRASARPRGGTVRRRLQ